MNERFENECEEEITPEEETDSFDEEYNIDGNQQRTDLAMKQSPEQETDKLKDEPNRNPFACVNEMAELRKQEYLRSLTRESCWKFIRLPGRSTTN